MEPSVSKQPSLNLTSAQRDIIGKLERLNAFFKRPATQMTTPLPTAAMDTFHQQQNVARHQAFRPIGLLQTGLKQQAKEPANYVKALETPS